MATSNETSNVSSSEHQTTSNQVDVEKPLKSTETKESFEVSGDFESMVDETIKKKSSEKTKQDEQIQVQKGFYSPEQAAGLAIKGLDGALGLVSKMNGFQIELPVQLQQVFASLSIPLIMKYGKTIDNLLKSKNVDLNSNMPEYLAVGAVAIIGIPTWLQIREVKKMRKVELVKQQKDKKTSEETQNIRAEAVAH